MAKTLREFLEARARKDFLSAKYIYSNAQTGLETNRRLKKIQTQAMMHRIFISPALDNHQITIGKAGLFRVSLMMLSIAGEAVKKLEDEVPDIHDRVPDFPWAHFKRLRDLNVKFGEAITSPEEIDKVTARLNREVESINKLGKFDGLDEKFKGLPYFYLICVCINWGSAIDRFSESSPGDEISLNPSPALKKLSQAIGMSESAIPIFFEAQCTRDLMHSISDQMKQPSVFFRRTHPKLYDKPTLEMLKKLRNKYAHFEDFFAADQSTTPENYFLDIETLNEEEFSALMRVYSHITNQLSPRVHNALQFGNVEGYAIQMARDYEQVILGTIRNDPNKRKIMDEMVEWITRGGVKPNYEDALVLATGALLDRFSADEARDILSHICRSKNDIGKPTKLLDGLEGKSHTIQVGVRSFVESMQQGLGVLTAKSAA